MSHWKTETSHNPMIYVGAVFVAGLILGVVIGVTAC